MCNFIENYNVCMYVSFELDEDFDPLDGEISYAVIIANNGEGEGTLDK